MATLQGIEILLIEDAADLALQMRRFLEGNGATVLTERTAKSGIAVAIEAFPHLIICDLGLAGGGGFQFISELKKTRGLSRVPILALTSGMDKSAILRALSIGAVDCLLKPFQTPVMLARALKLLEQSPFGTRKFAPTEYPVVSVTVPMEIHRVDECGFTVEAAVMLGPQQEVRLDSPLLEQLGCTGIVMRSSDDLARSAEGSGFSNEINLLGVSPKAAQAIRGFLRTRQSEESSS
jgi:DNA-binding response OmpR family regulator